jgi:hypothetical protein
MAIRHAEQRIWRVTASDCWRCRLENRCRQRRNLRHLDWRKRPDMRGHQAHDERVGNRWNRKNDWIIRNRQLRGSAY